MVKTAPLELCTAANLARRCPPPSKGSQAVPCPASHDAAAELATMTSSNISTLRALAENAGLSISPNILERWGKTCSGPPLFSSDDNISKAYRLIPWRDDAIVLSKFNSTDGKKVERS